MYLLKCDVIERLGNKGWSLLTSLPWLMLLQPSFRSTDAPIFLPKIRLREKAILWTVHQPEKKGEKKSLINVPLSSNPFFSHPCGFSWLMMFPLMYLSLLPTRLLKMLLIGASCIIWMRRSRFVIRSENWGTFIQVRRSHFNWPPFYYYLKKRSLYRQLLMGGVDH